MALSIDESNGGDDPDATTSGEPPRTNTQDDDPDGTDVVGLPTKAGDFAVSTGVVGAAGPSPASTHAP